MLLFFFVEKQGWLSINYLMKIFSQPSVKEHWDKHWPAVLAFWSDSC